MLFVLICVSLVLQSPVLLNIDNRYQDINLTSPIYFIHGGRWHAAPDQEADANSIIRCHFEFDYGQDLPEGALVCRIQRKYAGSDEPIQNGSISTQLLVAWRVERTKELNVRVLLVGHSKKLDEVKLRRLHQKYWHSLGAWFGFIERNWLLDDATALATTIKVISGGYRWDIFISEGTKDNIEMPLWINTER
jgi:hypothetical protein